MIIAFIMYPAVIISNRSNGIRSQAECWAKILADQGHTVVYINNWDNYNWGEFDIIHVFGAGEWLTKVMPRLSEINPKICISPIIDPSFESQSLGHKIKEYISNILYDGVKKKYIQFNGAQKILVRSEFEKAYLLKHYGIEEKRLVIVPLSYTSGYEKVVLDKPKENFCLHISSIYQSRKNVLSLIKAAKQFGFELYLAGNPGTEEQFLPLKEEIGDCRNIHVLGFVSEAEKLDLYKRAKVFALPSLTKEGVGIVAVDGALLGCEIVITNIPGPQEYYDGQAQIISPHNVNEIGQAIMKYMNDKVKYQPALSVRIRKKYSPSVIGELLQRTYQDIK